MDGHRARGESTKHQTPNTKLQRNPKLQIPKPVASSLPWSLGLGASLEFGVWSFNWRKDFPSPQPSPRSCLTGRGRSRCIETAPIVLSSILRTAQQKFGVSQEDPAKPRGNCNRTQDWPGIEP